MCVECGERAADRACGWRAYRVDFDEGDEPELAFYCQACAEREFDSR
jgi:hypothetical protein